MSCSPRRAPALALMLCCIAALISGCAATGSTPTILAALNCSVLIPPSWRQGIKGVALPGPTVGEIAAALDGQTARLDLANARTADVIAITEACDARANEVRAALEPRRPWWRVF